MANDYAANPFKPTIQFNEAAGFSHKYRHLDDPDVQYQFKLIKEEVVEMFTANTEGDRLEVIDGIADGIVTLTGLAHRMGVDINVLMERVNESNMSKFCTNMADAESSVEAYKNDERYKGVLWKNVDGRYVIYGRKAGDEGGSLKILKGIHYKPPYLEDLVGEGV